MNKIRINIITKDLPQYPERASGIIYYNKIGPFGRVVIEQMVSVDEIMDGVRHVWEPVDVVFDGVYQK